MKSKEPDSSIGARGARDQAERRQLTIVFCDVVGHTRIADQLGEEKWDEMLRLFQAKVAEAVEYFGGLVAELLGDGVVAWFGYPHAQENDAERGVRAGLKIVESVTSSRVEFEKKYGRSLSIRVGIHTGSVVVGKVGDGETRAVGVATSVAARIQAEAEPNTVLISPATLELVRGVFETVDCGPRPLAGVADPVRLYRVVRATDAQGRLDVASTLVLTPFVGRDEEIDLLLDGWKQVREGRGQVVLVEGEAGIGKSRLLRAFRDRLAEEPSWVECRSSSLHSNSAFYPLTELIEQTPGLHSEHSAEDKRSGLAEALDAAANAGLRRKHTLGALVKSLLAQAKQEPVVFVFENLHWLDSSTLDMIELLILQLSKAPVLLVLTFRPSFEPRWPDQPHVTRISLRPLTREHTKAMVANVAGEGSLSPTVLDQLVDKTDGLPLYVEELTRSVLESGVLMERDGEQANSLPGFSIPTTLQDSLMGRLDRLGPAKSVAQLAAVLGRDFSRELLAAVSTDTQSRDLDRDLSSLVNAGILVQGRIPANDDYSFRHALIQDTAYHSPLEATRRAWHARVAQVIEQQFATRAAAEPERLARHCEEGGLFEKAVGYYEKAAEQARQRFAVSEANTHLKQGIKLIEKLSEGPSRSKRKLGLQVELALNTVATEGWGAATSTGEYQRARELCKRTGELPLELEFVVIRGLIQSNVGKSRLGAAQAHIDELRQLARKTEQSSWLLLAHAHLGMVNHLRGDPAEALREFKEANVLYEREPDEHRKLIHKHGAELGVLIRIWTGWSLWIRGFPDQAKKNSHEAVELAKKISDPSSGSRSEPHPFTFAYANIWTAVLHWMRREPEQASVFAKPGLQTAGTHGLWFLMAYGMLVKPWVDLQNASGPNELNNAVKEMERCVTRIDEDMDIRAFRPRLLGYFAEALIQAGQYKQAINNVRRGIDYVEETGQGEWEAELYRLKGELLLKTEPADEAQAVAQFQRAVEIARRQQAKSLELRAAMSLARLWNQQSQFDRTREVLAPVYDWFTEGHDTADLKEAKALLESARAGDN